MRPSDPAALRRRAFAVGLLALASTASAAGTGWGGSEHAAYGSAVIAVKGQGKVAFVPNLRLEFDGASEDGAGSGTLTAYNEAGSLPLASFPFTWERKKSGFKAILEPEGLAALLADFVSGGLGMEASVDVVSASGKGKPGGEEERIRFAASGAGTVSLDGGLPVKLKAKIRCR